MTTEKPKKIGQPTKYQENFPELLLAMAADGMSDCQIARKLGVGRTTLNNWANDDTKPEFKAAWEDRKDYRQAFYEDLVRKIISGEEQNCSTAKKDLLIRTLVTQFPDSWADTRKTQLEITDKTKHMSDKELETTINHKIKQLLGLKPDLKLVDDEREAKVLEPRLCDEAK